MSSHHIVREDQEPALIIEDLLGVDQDFLHQLLEWSPTVIVSSSLAAELIARQIKVDVVIGTADPRPLQDAIRFIHSEKSFVDTAIRYLVKQGYKAAYLASTHTRPEILLSYLPDITITLFAGGIRYYPVRPGFSKWKPAEEIVYIKNTSNMEYTGLTQMEADKFQTNDDGFFTLFFSQKYLVIGETYSLHPSIHD